MRSFTLTALTLTLFLGAASGAMAQPQNRQMQNMPSMDHSQMQGMDHSKMPMNMQGMDHSNMPGMQNGAQGTRPAAPARPARPGATAQQR